jgi:hypothetical protein
LKIEGFGMDGKGSINSKWLKLSFSMNKARSGMDAEQ